MFPSGFLVLHALAVALAAVPLRHQPHDACYAVATAPLPGDGEAVLVVENNGRLLLSHDQGLHWRTVRGGGAMRGKAWEIAWHPRMGGGSSGLFLVASEDGIFGCEPESGEVEDLSAGLPLGGRQVLDIAAPRSGAGPAIAVTASGGVWLRWPGDSSWSLTLDTGLRALGRRAAAGVAPHFDPLAAAGPERVLAAAVRGVLYFSSDGGASWAVHPDFAVPAADGFDWLISTLAFADDWADSGVVLLGRVRLTGAGTWDEGEVLRSEDHGAGFQRVLTLETGAATLLGTPPDADGRSVFLLSGRAFPGTGAYQDGILRSEDAGLSWSDGGNAQDFLLEDSGRDSTGYGPLLHEQGMAAGHPYAGRGRLYLARHQGLFRSSDGGLHWAPVRVRPATQVRDIALLRGSAGDREALGASYGGGLLAHDLDAGTCQVIAAGSPVLYTRRLAASPNVSGDGTVYLADNGVLAAWYDPRRPPVNPFAASGFFVLPARDPVTGADLGAGARVVAVSPRHDGRGLPGSDRALCWYSWVQGAVVLSEDGGVTGRLLDRVAGGGSLGTVDALAMAPGWSPGGGGNDLYAGEVEGGVYRLQDGEWQQVASFAHPIRAIRVDPTFSRPDNPRLFVVLTGPPYVVLVEDVPGAVVVRSLQRGLQGIEGSTLALDPEFPERALLYLGTWAEGVFRLDLAAPAAWQRVGSGWPRAWTEALAVTATQGGGRLVLAGTHEGLFSASDQAGATWLRRTDRQVLDDSDETLRTFDPAAPGNPDPERPWPWEAIRRQDLPAHLPALGPGMSLTRHDGAWLELEGEFQELWVWSVAAPRAGALRVDVYDPATGRWIMSSRADLGLQPWEQARPHQVLASLPRRRPALARVVAELEAGEFVAVDAVTLH